jgi:hypothetical protein
MNNVQFYILPVVMMGAFIAYAVWMTTKTKKAVAGLGPAMHSFFSKTGFRYRHLPPEPIEAHVHQAMAEAQDRSARDRVTQYVRSFHGLVVQFTQAIVANETGISISASWTVPLQAPARVPFHIADKSLSSVGKAVREAFSNTSRAWQPRFPHPVMTGIPQLDARFVVYGMDPNAVRAMLQQNQALVAAILQSTEVDLWVDAREAVFSDPLQKNMNAALGGMVGQMALGFDYAKRMEMSIPVHDRMSEILGLSVRASQ